jgi:hypothetical protein
MTIGGQVAEVRWVYYTAATLGRWSLEAGVFSGTIVSADSYRLQQRPLTVLIPKQGRPWEWPIADVAIVGNQLTGHVTVSDQVSA